MAMFQARLSFFLASLVIFFVALFTEEFPYKINIKYIISRKISILAVVIVSFISLTPLVVKDVSLSPHSYMNLKLVTVTDWGELIYIYIIYLIFFFNL